jgi:nucleoside-diphosphate-sugar epimerase
LDLVLQSCCDNDVERFVLVTSTYIFNGLHEANDDTVPEPDDRASFGLFACERLCDTYRKNYGLSCIVLRVPCLFGRYESGSLIGGMMQQIALKGFTQIPGPEEQVADFLAQEDLGELLLRLYQDWPEHITAINIPGAAAEPLGFNRRPEKSRTRHAHFFF